MKNITVLEWLSIVGAILVSGVTVTAFAMSTFESADAAKEKESRLEKRIDRLEDLQIAMMKEFRVPIPERKKE